MVLLKLSGVLKGLLYASVHAREQGLYFFVVLFFFTSSGQFNLKICMTSSSPVYSGMLLMISESPGSMIASFHTL